MRWNVWLLTHPLPPWTSPAEGLFDDTPDFAVELSGKVSLVMRSILVEERPSSMKVFVVRHPRSGKIILCSWSKSSRIFLSERKFYAELRCAAGECLRQRSFVVAIMSPRWTFCRQSILCDTEPQIHLMNGPGFRYRCRHTWSRVMCPRGKASVLSLLINSGPCLKIGNLVTTCASVKTYLNDIPQGRRISLYNSVLWLTFDANLDDTFNAPINTYDNNNPA